MSNPSRPWWLVPALGGAVGVCGLYALWRLRGAGQDTHADDVDFVKDAPKATKRPGHTGRTSPPDATSQAPVPMTASQNATAYKPGFDYDDEADWVDDDDDDDQPERGWNHRRFDEYDDEELEEAADWSTEYSSLEGDEKEEFREAMVSVIQERLQELAKKRQSGKPLTAKEEEEITVMQEDLVELYKDDLKEYQRVRQQATMAAMPVFDSNGQRVSGRAAAADGGWGVGHAPGYGDDDDVEEFDDDHDAWGDVAGALRDSAGPAGGMNWTGDDDELLLHMDDGEEKKEKKKRRKVTAKKVVKKGYQRRADDFAEKVSSGGVPV